MSRDLIPVHEPIEHLPVVLLMPNESCTCHCVMCDIWRRPKPQTLSISTARAWAADWKALGVSRVALSGGDPLLHPDLEELLTIVGQAGAAITLITAGDLLSRHAEVVARWCDSVVVSLDGPPEIHDQIRQTNGAFVRLAAGVAEFRKAASKIPVTARCTLQQLNIGHLEKTLEAAKQLGLDRLSLLPVDSWSTAFNHGDGSGDRMALVRPSAADLIRFEAEIDALEEAGWSGLMAESPAKLRRRVLAPLRATQGLEQPKAPSCNAPWVSAVVEADGTVRPCFFHRPYGRLQPGQSLQELLGSAEARAFRRELDIPSDPVCQRCVCSLALCEGEDPR